MLFRRFTDFVLQGRYHAMATAFIIAFIPIVGLISIIIASLVTLRKGALEGGLVVLAATLPYVLSYLVTGIPLGDYQIALVVLAIFIFGNVLTWIFAAILRKFDNWSFVLELAALIGVLIVGIVHGLYPDIQSWWEVQLNNYLTKTAAVVGKITPDMAALNKETQAQAINAAKHFVVGFITLCVLSNALLQVLIAQWWQNAMFNIKGMRNALYNIRLGHIVALVFAVEIILAYIGNDFALDSMPILYGIFFMAGLSLIHRIISSTKLGWLWIVLLYGMIIWSFPLSIILIAVIALFDTGFDFRKRFLNKR